MVTTQYDIIVGTTLQTSGAVRQAATQVDQIIQEYRRLALTNVSGGPLSQQTIDSFASRLKIALQEAARSSGIMDSLNVQRQGFGGQFVPRARTVVESATPTPTTPLLAQQLRLAEAELLKAQIGRKAALPLGTEGAYKDDGARKRGEIQAAGAVERANKALEKAIADQIAAIDRAIRQQDKVTRQEERATLADVTMARRAPSFIQPDGATRVGRAQQGVNAAEDALQIATLRRTEAYAAANRTDVSLLRAEAAYEAATVAATAARARLTEEERRAAPVVAQQASTTAAATAAGGGGRSGGFGANFAAGFRGGGDNPKPYAEQLGQAFKFSVFYGTAYKLLSGITQTFQQTLQEGIEFQTAVSELALATGKSAEAAKELASNLGDRAAEAGFAPSEGALAGARGIGLYGATDASRLPGGEAQQARIADISARVATRVAFSSGLKTQDVQTNIAAITNAFGTGAEGQFRVADLDAYFSRRFGVASGGTIQAVAESANVGQAAGFDQEQINAIAAKLQGGTGQTATTIAGYMAQIFSRGGEGSLTAVAQRYGIDPTTTLADQIKELSRIYKDGDPNQQNQIAASFGRGKVQNAVTVLLSNFDEINRAADDVKAGAADGASDKAFGVRIGNIGGQIQLTVASLKEFANQLGQSGLLDAIGAGVLVLRELANAGSAVLKLFAGLPGPLRELAAATVALIVAQRLGAGGAAAGALGIFRGAPIGVGAPGIAGRYAVNTATGAVPLASRAGVAAAGSGLLTTLVNPVTAAVGGLLAIGAFKNKADKLNEAFESATEALNQGLASDAGADAITARASALKSTAEDTRDSASGFFASTINSNLGIGNNQSDAARNREAADKLDVEAARLEKVAALVRTNDVAPDKQLIDGFDETTLQTSMDRITQAGGNAADRLDALAASITGSGDAAVRAQASFNPTLFAGTNAAGAFDALQGSAFLGKSTPGFGSIIKGFATSPFRDGDQPLINDRKYSNVLPDLVSKYLSQDDLQKRLANSLNGVTDLSQLDAGTVQQIAESTLGDLPNQIGAEQGLDKGGVADLRKLMLDSLTDYLQAQADEVRNIVEGKLTLTGPELTSVVDRTAADLQDALGSLQDSDFSTRTARLKTAIATVKAAIAATPTGSNSDSDDKLADLQRQLAQSQFEQLEALRRKAQQNAGSAAAVAAVGRRYLRREINAAVKGGNADLLVQIVGQAGKGAIDIAQEAIKDALAVARAANRLRATALATAGNVDAEGFGRGGNTNPLVGAPPGQDVTGLKKLKSALDSATTAASKDGNVYASGSDILGTDSGAADKETAGDRRVAAAQAAAARSGSAIQAARADILGARVAMSQAKKGTVEYYNALGQLYQAQQSLNDAILDYKSNQYLLGIDMTNPLQQANVALKVARDKLRADAGKGADVRAADEVAVRNAQAEAEATRFQQRLDAVTTAEDLGRISHQKYLSYLDHEHDRLNGIKNRTFQQQQQLDQIDKLMQEAASSMNAQWNFGDIKLPTPYQVRRRLEELSPQAMAGNSDLSTNSMARASSVVNNRFDINGADTGAVLNILREALGQGARRTSNGRSRNGR